MNAAFGYAIATVARSQLAGIAVGVGLFFAEGIAGAVPARRLPVVPVLRIVRGDGGERRRRDGGGGGASAIVTQLDPNTAIIAVVVWLVVALGVTAVFTERAEIGG